MPDGERLIKLGVPEHPATYPLWWNLQQRQDFKLRTDLPANLAIHLRYRKLQGALLTPIDYARDYAMYRIVPGVAVSSRGKSNTILLQFTTGLRSIHSLAVDPSSTSEIVLTQLVLAEKYDIHPSLIPIKPGHPPPAADARLYVIDPREQPPTSGAIDVVDEWTDMMELPYIHQVWVSRPDDLTQDTLQAIIKSGEEGGKYPVDIFRQALKSDDAQRVTAFEEYCSAFEYSLDDQKISALTEFLRMAYYHGILQDIVDVKMHTVETKTHLPSSPDAERRN